MRYHYQVQYVPGKHQVTADTLSRAPLGLPELGDKLLVDEVEAFSTRTTSCLPVTPNRLQQMRCTEDRRRMLPFKIVLPSRMAPLHASHAVTTPILGKQKPPHYC